MVTRAEVYRRFSLDDPEQVRALLSDLCDSGFLLRLGRGPATAYRATTPEELSLLDTSTDGLAQFLWLPIYREGPASREQLAERTRVESERLETELAELVASGRVQLGNGHYSAAQLVVPADAPSGWEAAMLDHFQALVRTLCLRLRGGADPSSTGGSTYTFSVSPEHPLAPDVYGHLKQSRATLSELRARVDEYNSAHPDAPHTERVVVYLGQHVQKDWSEANETD